MEVFLLILKIIGIVLSSIIGFLLLLVLLLLFVPIRYKLEGEKGTDNNDIYGRINVSFLLHIISVSAVYDNVFNIVIRVFGIRLYDRNRPPKEKKTKKEKRIRKEKKSREKVTRKKEEKAIDENLSSLEYEIDWNDGADNIDDDVNIKEETIDINDMSDSKVTILDERINIEDAEIWGEHDSKDMCTEEDVDAVQDSDDSKVDEEARSEDSVNSSFSEKIDIFIDKIKDIYDKISNVIKKGELTAQRIADKINGIINKSNNFQKIYNDARNRKAISAGFDQVKYIVRKIWPKTIKGYIHMGFDDPATTGQILMIIGIIAPIFPRKLVIDPDFENVCFDGNILIKGRISIISAVIVLWRLFFNKDVKRLWYFIKKSS